MLEKELADRDEQMRLAADNIQEQAALVNELQGKIGGLSAERQENGFTNASLSRKAEELFEQVRILEQKLIKTKEKAEEEKNKLIAVHSADASKIKQKNNLLKANLADAEERAIKRET